MEETVKREWNDVTYVTSLDFATILGAWQDMIAPPSDKRMRGLKNKGIAQD